MIVDAGYLTFKLSFGSENVWDIWEALNGYEVTAFCCDSSNPFRRKDSRDYKAHRKLADPVILQKVKALREKVESESSLPISKVESCEADDLVSVYKLFNPDKEIMGVDKDYFQLEDVNYVLDHNRSHYTKQSVIDKIPAYLRELAQRNFALYQMLYGDSADGIKRILGKGKVGQEQAEDILNHLNDGLEDVLINMFEDKIVMNAKLVLFPYYKVGNFKTDFFSEWANGSYYSKESWESFYSTCSANGIYKF